jgi:U3 small nucleolar RNA-associated protein 13
LWSLEDKTGLRLRGTFRGHRRGIWHVQFSPTDQILATGSTDSTVRLWSIADFSCLKTFEGHSGSVLRVSFINGGTQVLTASADGLIKLWSVKTALCTLTLDQHEDKIWAIDGQ